MWSDHISNPKTLAGIFGAEVPSNTDWIVASITMKFADQIYVALEKDLYLTTAPKRWKEKAYDRFQLRLSIFGVVNVSFHGNLRGENFQFDVNPNEFRLHQLKETLVTAPLLIVECEGILVDVFPYTKSSYDDSPRWPIW
jgi:hypothetical protein